MIHSHIERFGFRDPSLAEERRACRSGFRAPFVNREERFVEHFVKIQIAIKRAGCHALKIGAAKWNIEGGLNAELLQELAERERWGLQFELR